jgi:pimeloyl-ACP methyl ester carboxylesterase
MTTVTERGAPAELADLPGVTHRFVTARGLRVHVAEAGAGEPLVLQHGWPQHWYAWHAVIPLLAKHYRVICPDMRGFGWTDAPRSGYDKDTLADDLLAVCDALKLDHFALAGHDWGGFVAFLAAQRAPERVERLVMLNTAHGFAKVDLRTLRATVGFWYMPILGTPGLGPMLMRRRAFMNAIMGWVEPGGMPWSPAELDIYTSQLQDRTRARATQRLYGSFVFRELIGGLFGRWKRTRLRVPTLFLHGDADRALRPEFLRGYEQHADDMRLELLPGVGHFVCETEPERVATRLIEFLSARHLDAITGV